MKATALDWIRKPGILILPVLLFCSCETTKNLDYSPNKKFSPQQLKEDFSLLKTVLEANHPSLYWYSTKDSLDGFYNEVFSSLNDSLSEPAFKNKVSWYITKIRDGHTSVQSSEGRLYYLFNSRLKRFPLYFKTWDDSLVVILNLNKDSVLTTGTVVTSIDGRANKYVIDSIFQFISTDGYADNFKNQALSFNFPLYYSFAFPVKDSFDIGYKDSLGLERSVRVPVYDPVKDSSERKKRRAEIDQLSEKEKRKLRLLNKRNFISDTAKNTAYMRISSFSGGRLRSFFSTSFKQLKRDSIQNLIIDLRENSGGSITVSGKLLRYLIDHPFRLADTVAAVNRSLPYSKYIKPDLMYKLAMFFTTRKKSDGKYHYTALESNVHKPYKRLHFTGNIYLLQGGFTFSSASMISGFLKGQENVTVVGEETGGGSYGTSAVYLPAIILPNSRLQITLPLYRIVFDKDNIKTGRGTFPDISTPPSSMSIKERFDPKLKAVETLIEEKKAIR